MLESTDKDLVFRRRTSLIVDGRRPPMHDSSPYRTNLLGRKAERLGSHAFDGVIRSARSQVKATLLPGLRTCAGPCLRFGAPIVRDPCPRKAVRGRPTMSPDHGR